MAFVNAQVAFMSSYPYSDKLFYDFHQHRHHICLVGIGFSNTNSREIHTDSHVVKVALTIHSFARITLSGSKVDKSVKRKNYCKTSRFYSVIMKSSRRSDFSALLNALLHSDGAVFAAAASLVCNLILVW